MSFANINEDLSPLKKYMLYQMMYKNLTKTAKWFSKPRKIYANSNQKSVGLALFNRSTFFYCVVLCHPYGVHYVFVCFVCRGSHPCLCYASPTDLGHAEPP